MARPAPSILAALLLACAGSTAMAQAERYELDALDRWRKVAESDPRARRRSCSPRARRWPRSIGHTMWR
ncbi:MAG: hypothetical protein ACO3QC_15270, partial [Phycisphaerales bacterium]